MEHFKPVSHTPPDSFFNKIKFHLRLLTDFQVRTVYSNLKEFIKNKEGKLLDVGCGDSPYKPLLDKKFDYIGIDYFNSGLFGYTGGQVLKFDGIHIPLESDSINHILCTEVLEHSEHPRELIREMYRVMKKNGEGFITIPWSSRFHYIPYDYFRFTPSMLKILFKDFSNVDVIERGTDITVIASKIIVVYLRHLLPKGFRQFILFPLFLISSPLLLLVLAMGHLSLALGLGSKDDPIGYLIKIVK